MKSTSKNTIIINLDETDVNGTVDRGGLIQQVCYEKLEAEITRDLGKLSQTPPGRSFPMGSGFVYFIDGTRGAGKTTFLRTVYDSISKSMAAPSALGQLAYIDPSRIEHSEIILLPILKELKRRVEEIQVQSALKDERRNSEFREQFKRIAGGLSLFSPGNDQLRDIDAELFLDWGLERAENSVRLRDNLHALIHTACGILNVKALILAFDDADTNASSAMKVLECIRKYLDTPELIVLVTGDMELYSQQVRDYFYDSMGKHLTAMDGERRIQRTKMVDHLEDQYLLKLFPIRRRIQLGPIWNLVSTSAPGTGHAMELNWSSEGRLQTRTLNSAINELVRRGLRLKNSHDVELYRSYLLKQPIRSILQVLSRCAEHLSPSDVVGELSLEWNKELSEMLSEGLRAMALGSLYKFGVDVDAIGALEMPALIDAVFELVVRDGELDTGAYLRPQSSDAALKSSFASLSSDVTRFCAGNPANLLQYLFCGPGSVAVWGQVVRPKSKEIEGGKVKVDELRAEFKKYVGTGRKEDALNWAWHATAILTAPYAANPSHPVVYFGVVGLNKRKPKYATGETAKSAIKACERAKSIPAFAFSLIDASGPGVGTFASIFNILGLIDRLLRLDLTAPKVLPDEVRQILAKVYKTPTISRPSWQGDEESTVDEGTQDSDELDDEGDDNLSSMTARVVTWLEKTVSLREPLKPSAVLIGKIWTRIYFSLEKVSDQQRGRLDAASLMELFALCVINAFLVEEFDHHLLDLTQSQDSTKGKIGRSNPLGAPSVVANKFHNTLVVKENLPLTFLIASCPLIIGMLQMDRKPSKGTKSAPIYDEMIKRLSTYGVTSDYLCNADSWKSLEGSCIAGKKWTAPQARKPKKVGDTTTKPANVL